MPRRCSIETILGWVVVVAIVVGFGYVRVPKKQPVPTVEVKVLSANVNGRLYTKEAGPNDFASQYVVMPADDNSGEAVILPWSVIKVSTHKFPASELVDGWAAYNKFVEDLRAKNDPLLPEALRVQSQLNSQSHAATNERHL